MIGKMATMVVVIVCIGCNATSDERETMSTSQPMGSDAADALALGSAAGDAGAGGVETGDQDGGRPVVRVCFRDLATDKYGYLDEKGNVAIEARFLLADPRFDGDYAHVWTRDAVWCHRMIDRGGGIRGPDEHGGYPVR